MAGESKKEVKRSKKLLWEFLKEELKEELRELSSLTLEEELEKLPVLFLKSENFSVHLSRLCTQFELGEIEMRKVLTFLFEYRFCLGLEGEGKLFTATHQSLQSLASKMCERLEIKPPCVIFDERTGKETKGNRAVYYPALKFIRILEFTEKEGTIWSWVHVFVHEMTHHYCHEKNLDQFDRLTTSHGINFRESFSKVYAVFKEVAQGEGIGIYSVPKKETK